MRARITWLAAALVSGVVLAFVVPLCLLVRDLATSQEATAANTYARQAAVLVASIDDRARLRESLQAFAQDSVHTTVSLPDGELLAATGSDPVRDELIARSRREGASFTVTEADETRVLVAVAVADGTAVVHSVVDHAALRGGVYAAWLTIGLLGAGLILLSVFVARRLGERISTPVTEMAEVAHRLRSGELDARARPGGPAEMVELGGALNQLADRIGELLAHEREAAADLSHRLRTPVTALRLDTDLIGDPVVRDRLRGHVDELHRAIDSVVAEARRPSREAMGGRCDASAVVAERAAHWSPLAEDQGRCVRVEVPATSVLVPLAQRDLADLVDNLLDNVFAHTPDGTPLRVSLRADPDQPTHAVLTIEDGGPGGPDAALLDRGRSGAGGTGLGLDIVSRLAAAGGGALHLATSPLGGLAAVVRLRRLGPAGPS